MSETLNQFIKEACIRREQSEQEERMKDYVAAGFTLEQALAAEKAYSSNRKRHPNGFIGRLTCVESPDGQRRRKSDNERRMRRRPRHWRRRSLRISASAVRRGY